MYDESILEKTSTPSATPDGHRAGSGMAMLTFWGTILCFAVCLHFPSPVWAWSVLEDDAVGVEVATKPLLHPSCPPAGMR